MRGIGTCEPALGLGSLLFVHRFIERFMHLHIHALEMIISFPPLPPDVCRNTHSFYMPFNLLARILYWIYSVARGDNKISISCQRTLQLTMSYNRWTRHHFLCRTRSLTSDGNESLEYEFLRISYRSPVSSGWNAIEKKRCFNFPPDSERLSFSKGGGVDRIKENTCAITRRLARSLARLNSINHEISFPPLVVVLRGVALARMAAFLESWTLEKRR